MLQEIRVHLIVHMIEYRHLAYFKYVKHETSTINL